MKLLPNVVRFLLLLLYIEGINSDKLINILLQKCYGICNKRYCNITMRCQPLNRTSKRITMEFNYHEGVILEAPLNLEVIAYKKFRTVYRPHMGKFKLELCAQLINMDHPFFKIASKYWKSTFKGNFLDPCPFKGHRYVKPYVSNYSYFPLVPIGEWKIEFILSKIINNSEVVIISWSDFYEVKPTSAEEF